MTKVTISYNDLTVEVEDFTEDTEITSALAAAIRATRNEIAPDHTPLKIEFAPTPDSTQLNANGRNEGMYQHLQQELKRVYEERDRLSRQVGELQHALSAQSKAVAEVVQQWNDYQSLYEQERVMYRHKSAAYDELLRKSKS